MYGKAACPVPRGAGDSTGIWKRYCGTIAKAGGNGENKLLPAVTEGSCLLERSDRAFSFFLLGISVGKILSLLKAQKPPIILGWFHADFLPCNFVFQFLSFNTTFQNKIRK